MAFYAYGFWLLGTAAVSGITGVLAAWRFSTPQLTIAPGLALLAALVALGTETSITDRAAALPELGLVISLAARWAALAWLSWSCSTRLNPVLVKLVGVAIALSVFAGLLMYGLIVRRPGPLTLLLPVGKALILTLMMADTFAGVFMLAAVVRAGNSPRSR